jgi:hypothetical protein
MPNSNEPRRWCISEVLQAYASPDLPKEHPQMVSLTRSFRFFILSLSLSLSGEKSQIQTEQRGFTKWSDVASPASLIIIRALIGSS